MTKKEAKKWLKKLKKLRKRLKRERAKTKGGPSGRCLKGGGAPPPNFGVNFS